MNVFDQAARFAAKSDPAGFFRWLLPDSAPAPEFRGWLDARTLPWPGEPDRTCDTVAELLDPAGPAAPWALAVEFQAEPDPDMLDRLLEYLARLRRELRHGPGRRGKFRVAAALVQLTGPPTPDTLDMTWPAGLAIGLRLRIVSRALRDQDAASTLADIASGRTSRGLLPWIPLRKGAAKPTMVQRWKQLAEAEPDRRSRANDAGLALIFVELTRHASTWRRALKGWDMRESTVAEWKAEGKAEGEIEASRAKLLRVLELRLPGQLPAGLADAVGSQARLDELSRWFDAAVTASSLSSFLSASGIGRSG